VGKLIQGEAEGRPLPCPEGWLYLNERAIDGSGGGSETPVNTLFSRLLLVGWQSMPCDLLSEDNRRWCLAVDARREDLLGENFGACAGKSADQAGKCAFEDGALADNTLFRGHGGEMRCDA